MIKFFAFTLIAFSFSTLATAEEMSSWYKIDRYFPKLSGCVGTAKYPDGTLTTIEVRLQNTDASLSESDQYDLTVTERMSLASARTLLKASKVTCQFDIPQMPGDRKYLFSCEDQQKSFRVEMTRIETLAVSYFQVRSTPLPAAGQSAVIVNLSRDPHGCYRN